VIGCHVIVGVILMNAHARTENESDDTEEDIYVKVVHVVNQFAQLLVKILLDLSGKWRENVFCN
jgi:hypothetical protein